MTAIIEADIVVVGAGLVGLSAAIAFALQGKKIVLVDAKKPDIKLKKAWDERVYALTPATQDWLKNIGVWPHIDASRVNPIHAMHIFDEANQQLVLRDEEANLPKLGVMIENQNLMYALWQQLNKLDVIVITDALCQTLDNTQQQVVLGLAISSAKAQQISAKLMVAADGVDSWVRKQANVSVTKKDFHQTAVVANFVTQKSHQNVARQWFRSHDVLAFLPLVGQNVSMVWSVSTERAAELLALSGEGLAHNVHEYSKGVLGTLKQQGNTQAFALNQQTAMQLIADRVVLIGDAAHQIHPMAGQGVNLGFRDVMQLTSIATKLHAMQNVGDKGFLRQYERARKADIVMMNQLTSGLDGLFASESSVLKKARQWGLQQLNGQAAIKKLLIQQAAA